MSAADDALSLFGAAATTAAGGVACSLTASELTAGRNALAAAFWSLSSPCIASPPLHPLPPPPPPPPPPTPPPLPQPPPPMAIPAVPPPLPPQLPPWPCVRVSDNYARRVKFPEGAWIPRLPLSSPQSQPAPQAVHDPVSGLAVGAALNERARRQDRCPRWAMCISAANTLLGLNSVLAARTHTASDSPRRQRRHFCLARAHPVPSPHSTPVDSWK